MNSKFRKIIEEKPEKEVISFIENRIKTSIQQRDLAIAMAKDPEDRERQINIALSERLKIRQFKKLLEKIKS